MSRIRIEAGAYLLLALGLLVLPIRWFLAALTAAGFHELCHWTAAALLGARVRCITLGCSGGVMDLSPMTAPREAVCALAGPLGSFVLVSLGKYWPELALMALGQGIFNLIPVYPLDGGRFLRCLAGERIGSGIENVFLFLLAAVCLLALCHKVYLPVGIMVIVFLRIWAGNRNSSCKESNPSVQ